MSDRPDSDLAPSKTVAPSSMASANPNAAPEGGLATMQPAYFSMVMATGIISIAAQVLSHPGMAPGDPFRSPAGAGQALLRMVAGALLLINLIAYFTLWILTIIRILRYRSHIVADLMHHGRCVGFFTTVAATCVLGSQVWIVGGPLFGGIFDTAWMIAASLWILGAVLWAVMTYTILTILTVKSVKPALADGINGSWLLTVVAAQALCILGAQLSLEGALSQTTREALMFGCLVMWLGGAMLYVWIISLIFYRYTFFPFRPSDLAPPYWINMGAMAISALAGATLLLAGRQIPLIQDLIPFIKGATILFWATASLWVPMLIILGVWRHVVNRFPLRYDPLYWGAVFPLGVYCMATTRMMEAMGLPYLRPVPPVFLAFALAAWSITMIGLLHHLSTGVAPAAARHQTQPR